MPREKVYYECSRCNYTTNKKSHYETHVNRKFPCKPQSKPVQTKSEPTIAELQSMLNQLKDKLHHSEPQTHSSSKAFVCSKCDHALDTDIGLKIHISKCTGTGPLKCPNCLKEFATRKGKCKHMHNVVCKRVEPKAQSENKCPKCQCVFEPNFNGKFRRQKPYFALVADGVKEPPCFECRRRRAIHCVAKSHPFQRLLTPCLDDFAIPQHLYLLIIEHALLHDGACPKLIATMDDIHPRSILTQEHRLLHGRIAATDHDERLLSEAR